MKTLPLEFNKDGFSYTQAKRQNNVAVYAQIIGDKIIAYEVVVIKKYKRDRPPYEIKGNEYYPRSSQWGNCG